MYVLNRILLLSIPLVSLAILYSGCAPSSYPSTTNSVTKLEEVIHEYDRKLTNNPEDKKTLVLRANAFYKSNKYDESLKDITQLNSLGYDDPQLTYLKALNYLHLEQYQEAHDLLLKLEENQLNEANIWMHRGLALFYLNKPVKGIELINMAIAHQPTYIEAHYNLAKIYFALNKPTRSIWHLDQVLDLSTNIPYEVYKDRATAYIHLGEYEMALSDIDKWTQIDSLSLETDYFRGLAYYHLKDYENAILYAQSAVEKDSTKSTYFLLLGNAQHANGQTRLANQNFQYALKLDPESAKIEKNVRKISNTRNVTKP